jgi:hypothetical protein
MFSIGDSIFSEMVGLLGDLIYCQGHAGTTSTNTNKGTSPRESEEVRGRAGKSESMRESPRDPRKGMGSESQCSKDSENNIRSNWSSSPIRNEAEV